MSTPTSYTDLLTHYWPGAHWAKDTDIVKDEITLTFNRKAATNTELCSAVRYMAGPEWKGKGVPGLRDLIIAVWTIRKAGKADDAAPIVKCGLCSGIGLVEFWPGLHGKQASLDAYSLAYSLTVPCGCDAGRHARGKEWDHAAYISAKAIPQDVYDGWFQHACDQQGDRNRLAVACHAATGFRLPELAAQMARKLTIEPDEFDPHFEP